MIDIGAMTFFSAYMSQPSYQLDVFKSWAGKSSDISYYLNSHHVDFLVWAQHKRARPVWVIGTRLMTVFPVPSFPLFPLFFYSGSHCYFDEPMSCVIPSPLIHLHLSWLLLFSYLATASSGIASGAKQIEAEDSITLTTQWQSLTYLLPLSLPPPSLLTSIPPSSPLLASDIPSLMSIVIRKCFLPRSSLRLGSPLRATFTRSSASTTWVHKYPSHSRPFFLFFLLLLIQPSHSLPLPLPFFLLHVI